MIKANPEEGERNMKLSVCHYSFHKTWSAEGWDATRLAEEVKKIGVGAIDFHVGFLGAIESAAESIRTALDKSGLELSGLSLAADFAQDDPKTQREQIDKTLAWMRVAKEVEAPVSRIFGSPNPSEYAVYVADSKGADKSRVERKEMIITALREVTREAESLDLVLALENHYGFPLTAEEQVEVIERVNSRYLRATVDIGNYMTAGQDPETGTAIAAPYAAYVHEKDFSRIADASISSGWRLVPHVVGSGDIDHARCLQILKDSGFDGYVAIEYEGEVDERTGIAQSAEFLKKFCQDQITE